MTKEQVIYLRELYKGNVEIFFDNALLADPNLDGTIVIWDDDRELITVINKETRCTRKTDILSRTSAYEHIQAITASMTKQDCDKMIDQLKSDISDGIDQDVIDKYNKQFKKLSYEEIIKNKGRY